MVLNISMSSVKAFTHIHSSVACDSCSWKREYGPSDGRFQEKWKNVEYHSSDSRSTIE